MQYGLIVLNSEDEVNAAIADMNSAKFMFEDDQEPWTLKLRKTQPQSAAAPTSQTWQPQVKHGVHRNRCYLHYKEEGEKDACVASAADESERERNKAERHAMRQTKRQQAKRVRKRQLKATALVQALQQLQRDHPLKIIIPCDTALAPAAGLRDRAQTLARSATVQQLLEVEMKIENFLDRMAQEWEKAERALASWKIIVTQLLDPEVAFVLKLRPVPIEDIELKGLNHLETRIGNIDYAVQIALRELKAVHAVHDATTLIQALKKLQQDHPLQFIIPFDDGLANCIIERSESTKSSLQQLQEVEIEAKTFLERMTQEREKTEHALASWKAVVSQLLDPEVALVLKCCWSVPMEDIELKGQHHLQTRIRNIDYAVKIVQNDLEALHEALHATALVQALQNLRRDHPLQFIVPFDDGLANRIVERSQSTESCLQQLQQGEIEVKCFLDSMIKQRDNTECALASWKTIVAQLLDREVAFVLKRWGEDIHEVWNHLERRIANIGNAVQIAQSTGRGLQCHITCSSAPRCTTSQSHLPLITLSA